MARLKFYFCYDGTHYNGWQRQKNTPNTIQQVMEDRLSKLAGDKRISLQASGRTDAGVHARVQVAHAMANETLLKYLRTPAGGPGSVQIDQNRLQQSLNALLPPDIRVLRIDEADADFHAQRDVVKKTYVYFINPNPVQWPELRDHAWHLKFPLKWDAVEEATRALVGEHDFKAFCAADADTSTTIRTIHEARWGTVNWQGMMGPTPLRVLRLTGSGFLKHMVRSIAGTLTFIGNGKAGPELVSQLLARPDRSEAGPTAPAHGLWLWDILY